MLEFNVGELATRLRSALGVRGRIPLGLDEHVVPTVLSADLSVPPWRRNPVFSSGGAFYSRATVGHYAAIAIRFRPGPLSASSRFIVTGILCQPLNFVTASGVAVPQNRVSMIWRPRLSGGPVSGATEFKLITTERYNVPSSASYEPWRVPVEMSLGFSLTAPAVDAEGVMQVYQAGAVQPATFVPCQIALGPDQAIDFISTTPTSATDTSALSVSVQGLFYGLGG